jgi:hypothetical protein
MLRNYAPREGLAMFLAVMMADTMGIFSMWRVDFLSAPGTNSWEDGYL